MIRVNVPHFHFPDGMVGAGTAAVGAVGRTVHDRAFSPAVDATSMRSLRHRAAIVVLGAGLLTLAASSSLGQTRTWTDASGAYRTEADLVDVVNGIVRLKKTSGEIVSVPLARLSQADQAFLTQRANNAATPANTADPLAPSVDPVIIELLTGAQIQGRIAARDATSLTVETAAGQYISSRKIPFDRIRAVVAGGRRTVLSQAAQGTSPVSPSPASSSAPPPVALNDGPRTPAEINRLIAEMGRTTPEWWNATPLNYPQTLDLTWPERAEGPWDPQKNVGQYLWDVIKPNPSKWREGTRFVHYLLEEHKGDRAKRERDMKALGELYFLLLRDFARAAFWWRQAGVDVGTPGVEGIHLAECFWRLGSKSMALEFLRRKRDIYFSTVKLLADMGETRLALQWAESAAKLGAADQAYLYAGDACRIEGQYDQAIRYYQRVLKIQPRGNEGEMNRVKRCQARAQANIDAIRIFDKLDLKKIPDGAYRASAPGYAGDVQVEVAVRAGRIVSVKVTQHKEKQYYGAMIDTPIKIVQRQGVKGVDTTTSATITSEAIINATAQALATAH